MRYASDADVRSKLHSELSLVTASRSPKHSLLDSATRDSHQRVLETGTDYQSLVPRGSKWDRGRLSTRSGFNECALADRRQCKRYSIQLPEVAKWGLEDISGITLSIKDLHGYHLPLFPQERQAHAIETKPRSASQLFNASSFTLRILTPCHASIRFMVRIPSCLGFLHPQLSFLPSPWSPSSFAFLASG